jgi:hypothetical protein
LINYYGRKNLNGKLIRESIRQSLETAVWTTAKLKPADFLKGKVEGRGKIPPPLFSEAVELVAGGAATEWSGRGWHWRRQAGAQAMCCERKTLASSNFRKSPHSQSRRSGIVELGIGICRKWLPGSWYFRVA